MPEYLSRYETELAQRRFNKPEGGPNILINPRKSLQPSRADRLRGAQQLRNVDILLVKIV